MRVEQSKNSSAGSQGPGETVRVLDDTHFKENIYRRDFMKFTM